jgi:hypothetical protein
VIIDSLRGENLDDLLNKLEQEKEKWLSKIDLKERCICDKCEGLGMIEI